MFDIIVMMILMVSSLNSQDTNNQVSQVPVQNENLIRLQMSKQRRAEQYEAAIGKIASGKTVETLKSTTEQKPS